MMHENVKSTLDELFELEEMPFMTFIVLFQQHNRSSGYFCSGLNYATVYVLMYIMVGLLRPLGVLLLAAYYKRLTRGACLWVVQNRNQSKA